MGAGEPPRRLIEDRVVIATHNAGKLREISDLLAPFAITVIAAKDRGLAEPEETGDNFAANAELKARAAAMATGLVALADDSGLAIDALDGAPGIHSARWAGSGRDFNVAMRRIEDELAAIRETGPKTGKPADRCAHFACALALCWPDGHCETFLGRVDGALVWPPRGERGFGYDPMFVPAGGAQTFGEMAPEAKHRISHRADAFQKLLGACLAGRRGGE